MSKIWVIPPQNNDFPERFKTAWDYDKKYNTIAIGWPKLGNPQEFLGDQGNQRLKSELIKVYPTYSKEKATKSANFIRKFYQEIKKGDIIIAREGLMKIIGVGIVFSKNNRIRFYNDEKGKERQNNDPEAIKDYDYYPNFLNVNWNDCFKFQRGVTIKNVTSFESIIDKDKLAK